MYRSIPIALVGLSCVSCGAIDWARVRGVDQTPEQTAIAFVTALSENDIDAAVKMFDPTVYDAMSVDQVREIWLNLLVDHGAFVKFGEVGVEKSNAHDVVFVPCEFEDETVRFQVTINDSGEVAGFVRRYGAHESKE